MRLPFEPEPDEVLRERFWRALEPTLDAERIRPRDRPGLHRRHVLDFESGLRLIVSRELHRDGVKVHVSASVMSGSRLFGRAARITRQGGKAGVQRWFRTLVEAVLRRQLGAERKLVFVGWSSGNGIPHWLIPDGEPATAATVH